VWQSCEPHYCLGEALLDLTLAGAPTQLAAEDYDEDGVVEANAEEFLGLVGTTVTVLVTTLPTGWSVLAVNGRELRQSS
jgi:hypothetical protein